MTEILTYSLKGGKKRSDDYFNEVEVFADEVNEVAEKLLGNWVEKYQKIIQKTNLENLRGKEAYAFELLTLGVLWPIYISDAEELGKISQKGLSWLTDLRQKFVQLKPIVDPIRGIWGSLVLFSSKNLSVSSDPLITQMDKLLNWMQASGEYKEEVKRLKGWQSFIKEMGEQKANEFLAQIIKLGEWFRNRSEEVLGKYTQNVDAYIEERQEDHRWMEDIVLVGRKQVEYHLNMVGMEILNREVKELFAATPKKVVYLPPCLRIKKDGCEAYETPFGEHCNACEPNCRIHQITKLGEKHDFEVFFLPDRLNSLNSEGDSDAKPKLGIVGVACPLMVVTGGWQTRDMNLPAMGLPLDHCGCHWHWDLDGGIVTDVNFGELLKIVGAQDEGGLKN
ncbi:MAG: DUF116 domain-containing protein [Chloroflexi bacterium]|nr:DUF116 domain-containing protein [Chloroflexota bacterium]MBT3670879.1 DUF116 domain-containing protein [Chloroflexota bacterium]MBT4004269.1 DUF116 domain-containing protein [Chloroflexota bacterium]MBT4306407.1 DUF116 domain-containing protein [Chloroflexota bacterium]MBT4532712.1 DUF116 domain-containing protein [Chloroflexota bacterium]